MLFLTLVFLSFTFVSLVKGKLFYQFAIDLGEENIKQQTDSDYKPNTSLAGKMIAFSLFAIVYLVTYFIYLTNAIGLDPLKYPSLLMFLWVLINFIMGYKNRSGKLDFRNQDVVNKFRKKIYKKRTLKGTIGNLISTIYFVYMVYVIVF